MNNNIPMSVSQFWQCTMLIYTGGKWVRGTWVLSVTIFVTFLMCKMIAKINSQFKIPCIANCNIFPGVSQFSVLFPITIVTGFPERRKKQAGNVTLVPSQGLCPQRASPESLSLCCQYLVSRTIKHVPMNMRSIPICAADGLGIWGYCLVHKGGASFQGLNNHKNVYFT